MPRKYFIICLLFSIWTVIQTTFHLLFMIYAYYFSICQKSPTEPDTIFLYLTYLYNRDCSVPKLGVTNETHVVENYISKFFYLENNPSLEKIVEELLLKIDLFPDHAAASSRTSVFLLCFIILDGTWVISAVALLMGTVFGIKQSLSLVFYGPWLVMTICVCLFDAAASVLFGLDIAETTSFTDWINFVGITQSSAFEDLDAKNPQPLLSAIASIALCCISTRFIFIWISNWVGFIFVVKATISVYHESYKNEVPPRRPRSRFESPEHRVDLDTSAARIRNWQLFYGAVDTTVSSGSSKSEKDLNCNSRGNAEEGHEESEFYHAYPDVAASIMEGGCLEELRGQLPWSYIQSKEEFRSEEEIKIELKRREHRLTSVTSSTSGTEL